MTVIVKRVILAAGGSVPTTAAAAHALFLARVLDASLQAVSTTGTPQSPATETTEVETVGAPASAAFEAEEAVGVATRRAFFTGVRLTPEVVDGSAATVVILGVGGDNEARLAGHRVTGTAASHVVCHVKVPTLVVPLSVGDDDVSGPCGRR